MDKLKEDIAYLQEGFAIVDSLELDKVRELKRIADTLEGLLSILKAMTRADVYEIRREEDVEG